MEHRQYVEEKILFILLNYKKGTDDKNSYTVFDILRKHSVIFSDFQYKSHQDVFKAIANQMHENFPNINVEKLVDYRPKDYKIFPQQTNEFLNIIVNLKNSSFATFSDLDNLLFKLKEFVMIFHVQALGQNIMSTNFTVKNVVEYVDTTLNNLKSLYDRVTDNIIEKVDTADDLINKLIERKKAFENGEPVGIKIEIQSIKNVLKAWKAPDLIFIGARPSMGKTTTAINIADDAAAAGNETVYLSIEMSKEQMVNLITSKRSGIDIDKIKDGNLTNEELILVSQWYQYIESSPLNIIPSSYRVLEDLIAYCKKLYKQNKIKFLIIDYLQLLRTREKFGNRDQQLGHITGELKALALEINIPIIVLSQLKRDSTKRKPVLEDFRESGNIEQDADIAAFIHREAFYQENYNDLPYREQFTTDFIIKKHRGGALGEPKYFQDVKNSKITDI